MNLDNLIFIVAQPRSGSTLLQGILSNNDYINTTSESWLILPFLNIFDSSLMEAKYNQQLTVTGVFDFTNKVGGKDVLVEKLRDILYAPFFIQSFLEENRSDERHVREVNYENLIQIRKSALKHYTNG